MLFTEHDFLDRFAAAADAGFAGVEILDPYAHDEEAIARALERHGLTLALINTPAGERLGLAGLPGHEREFEQSLTLALRYARVTGAERIHVLAGNASAGIDRAVHHACLTRNLREACARAAGHGVMLTIEPLNPRDRPGYILRTQGEARAIHAAVDAANLTIQCDLYHCALTEGDPVRWIAAHGAALGHVQIGGVPDRHEPDAATLDYPGLFAQLDAMGYAGWVGCEYRPRAGTREGLGWLAPYLA